MRHVRGMITRRPGVVVAAGFAAVIAIYAVLIGVQHIGPSSAEWCQTKCSHEQKEGHMVSLTPASQRTPGKYQLMECRCYQPGDFNPFQP